MIKYRIKTEKEFIDEFGVDWRTTINGRWRPDNEMDFLFNMEIEQKYVDIIKENNRCYRGEWIISIDMIKEVNIVNYNEKKTLVYD